MKMRVFLTLAIAASSCVLGCTPVRHNLPPAQRLLEPGPGVGGPGPGVLTPDVIPVSGSVGAAVASDGTGLIGSDGSVSSGECIVDGMNGAGGAMGAGGMVLPAAAPNIQVLFTRPEGMEIHYDVVGDNTFGSEPLYVPGRLEFAPGGIYRLKLTNIQGREGVELYPTLEVANANPRTAAYLAHNAIPIQFNPDDFEQVLTGNFVTKVIYLPDPEFQGDALVGVDVLVSNRLDPGLDPIVEADRRGSILAILRIGNKDIEMAGIGGGAGVGAIVGAPIMCGPGGMANGGIPTSLPGYVAGVTSPQYGMTYSGTPIGLPGPPHIPLGSPAGLKKHTMRNSTHRHLPDPVSHMKIHMRQVPGQSYPLPASRVSIREQNIHPGGRMDHAPIGSQSIPAGDGTGAYCPPQ